MSRRREALEAELRELLGARDRASAGDSVRAQHGRDQRLAGLDPDVVAFPLSTAEVAAVVRFAAERRLPLIPFGAGTSSGGKFVAPDGGISLDLSRMDRVLAIHPEDFDVVVQPGVLRKGLNRRLGEHGLFFPVDPGADASLGGMASTNASGTTTFRYGGMRANTLALEVVLADGSVARTGARARKTSAGYDVTGLFVGAEGTLGVITELTLRLHPIVERIVLGRAAFADLETAVEAVVALSRSATAISRLELLDGPTVAIVNRHSGGSLPEAPTLFIEFGGSPLAVDEEIALSLDTCRELGEVRLEVERDPTAQHRLWEARYEFGHALLAARPGKTMVSTDVCVPISELPGAIANGRALIAAEGLEACLVAHAGDGNFHFVFAVDADSGEPAAVERINAAMVDHALTRGGTSTAEHGVGLELIGALEREHGDLLPTLRALKGALDPGGLMNPGKMLSTF